jgi:uncharacterized surface protein with fasciclin (FAS1) repeats
VKFDSVLPMERTSILRLAAAIGGFELFLAAVEIAGLGSLLDGVVPLTVFAPTDAAFGTLSDVLFTRLLARRAANLEPFVRAHLVAGSHCGRAMTGLGRLRSLAGDALDVDAFDGGVLVVSGAVVVSADLYAANGVLHGIDQVLSSGGWSEGVQC